MKIDEKALAYVNQSRAKHEMPPLSSVLKATDTELLWGLRNAVKAIEAAKVAEQPCAGINKAALDQASAARKQYRADTPVSLQSIEGEDAVFVAAYLEAAGQPDDCADVDERAMQQAWALFLVENRSFTYRDVRPLLKDYERYRKRVSR